MTNDSKEPFTVQAGKKCKFCGLPQPASNPYCFCENGPEPQEWINWKNGDYIPPNAEWQYWENKTMTKDEWGPWIGWNGGECPVDDGVKFQVSLSSGIQEDNTTSGWTWNDAIDNPIVAYRIKKEPEVKTYAVVYLEEADGFFHSHAGGEGIRKAIITLTNGEPSIRWADERD